MSQKSVIKLIHSLSRAEKRQFKLYTKKQSGNKAYLDLFKLIDQKQITEKDVLEKEFRKTYPDSSLDNTSRYLMKVILDCLIQSRVKDQDLYQLLYGLLRVNILKERNMPEEGFKELNRLQELSEHSQNSLIQYFIYRERLNYFSNNNLKGLSEKKLITIQMKAREIIKDARNTHEHYSLYELLKFRLNYSAKVLSDEGKKQLNDLLLNEIGIVSARIKGNLESRKLHLLFQSYFFTHIGDYRSALKTFHELNRLFEKNTALLANPPLDYFSSLDGILDSLRTNGYFEEMNFYIEKLISLDDPSYPEYFCFLVKKTILIYQMAALIHDQKYKPALDIINKSGSDLWKAYSMMDEEKQSELLFYLALVWFFNKRFKESQNFLNEIILIGKINHHSVIYKAARLVSILINYENKKLDYLDYEIRSYKRNVRGKQKFLKTERLIFKVIKMNPDFNGIQKNNILWKSIVLSINDIHNDRYEKQLLKYYDFIAWMKKKFNR